MSSDYRNHNYTVILLQQALTCHRNVVILPQQSVSCHLTTEVIDMLS